MLSLPQLKIPNGIVLYRGISKIDNKTPIVAIATLKTENTKTGNMIQTWILLDRHDPISGVYSGKDKGICGNCPHRGDDGIGRTCYVNVATAPNQIYKNYRVGNYLKVKNQNDILPYIKNRLVRIGSYGDPTAVPFEIWENIAKNSLGITSYSHQWKKNKFQKFKNICMASCESYNDFRKARSMGWRTFRVRKPGKRLYAGEFDCPASPSGGMKRFCENCRACAGTRFGTLSARAGCVSIEVHGKNKHLF